METYLVILLGGYTLGCIVSGLIENKLNKMEKDNEGNSREIPEYFC